MENSESIDSNDRRYIASMSVTVRNCQQSVAYKNFVFVSCDLEKNVLVVNVD